MRWNLDPTHTSVEFAVRHMMIATVRGTMGLKEGYVETDETGKPIRVEARLDAASIHTGVADRDNHLRSPDFLDVANHPEIVFRSEKITPLGGKLNRKDFGLTWNMPLETGGLLVGEEVRFSVDTQAVKAKEAVAQ